MFDKDQSSSLLSPLVNSALPTPSHSHKQANSSKDLLNELPSTLSTIAKKSSHFQRPPTTNTKKLSRSTSASVPGSISDFENSQISTFSIPLTLSSSTDPSCLLQPDLSKKSGTVSSTTSSNASSTTTSFFTFPSTSNSSSFFASNSCFSELIPLLSQKASNHQRSKSFHKSISEEQEKLLSADIYRLNESLAPRQNVIDSKNLFFKKIEKLIKDEFPDSEFELRLYGSSASGLGSYDSDMDICLVTQSKAFSNILKINSVFLKHCFHTYCIPNARVPIVKLWDPQLKISADININNTIGLHNTEMIKLFISIDPRVKPFIMTIKHWTKQRDINDAAFGGTLSPYAWVNMALFFLQTRDPPILPVIHPHEPTDFHDGTEYRDRKPNLPFHNNPKTYTNFGAKNKDSIGKLLFLFFKHFGLDFDYQNQVISVRSGKYIPKKQKGWDVGRPSGIICIEEPFSTWLNLAHGVNHMSVEGIRGEFIRAHNILANNGLLKSVCKAYKSHNRPQLSLSQASANSLNSSASSKSKLKHCKTNRWIYADSNQNLDQLPVLFKNSSYDSRNQLRHSNSSFVASANSKGFKPGYSHNHSLSTDTLVSPNNGNNYSGNFTILSPLPQSPIYPGDPSPYNMSPEQGLLSYSRILKTTNNSNRAKYEPELNYGHDSDQDHNVEPKPDLFNAYRDLDQALGSTHFSGSFSLKYHQSIPQLQPQPQPKKLTQPLAQPKNQPQLLIQTFTQPQAQVQAQTQKLEQEQAQTFSLKKYKSNSHIQLKKSKLKPLISELAANYCSCSLPAPKASNDADFANHHRITCFYSLLLPQNPKSEQLLPRSLETHNLNKAQPQGQSAPSFRLSPEKRNLSLKNQKNDILLDSLMYYDSLNPNYPHSLLQPHAQTHKAGNTNSRLCNITDLDNNHLSHLGSHPTKFYSSNLLFEDHNLKMNNNLHFSPMSMPVVEKFKPASLRQTQYTNSRNQLSLDSHKDPIPSTPHVVFPSTYSIASGHFRRYSLPSKLLLTLQSHQKAINENISKGDGIRSSSDLTIDTEIFKRSEEHLQDLSQQIEVEIPSSGSERDIEQAKENDNEDESDEESSDHSTYSDSDENYSSSYGSSALYTDKAEYYTPMESPINANFDTSASTSLAQRQRHNGQSASLVDYGLICTKQ